MDNANAQWKVDNKDRMKEKQKEWRENNKERSKELQRLWRLNNPDYDKERYKKRKSKMDKEFAVADKESILLGNNYIMIGDIIINNFGDELPRYLRSMMDGIPV